MALAFVFCSGCGTKKIRAPKEVYGDFCGFVGVGPAGRIALNKMLSEGDTTGVRKLLRSRGTVDQAYGTEGMLRFQLAGAKLSKEDPSRIEALRRSNADVYTCSGCLHYPEPLSKCIQRLENLLRP